MAEAAARACLICGGTDHRVVFRELGTEVLRCRACGHVWSGWDAEVHYDGYWGDEVSDPGAFYWDRAHRPMYEDFAARYLGGEGGRLLDVGCGLGYFVRFVERGFPGWEAHGCEISAAAVRYGTETLSIANLRAGRLEDAGYPEAHFDRVTLWDVIEHLREPDPLLREVHRLLRPGGLCFVHTPNVALQLPKARLKRLLRGVRPGVHYLEARDHLHLYSRRSIGTLLERCGYREIEFVHLRPIQSVAGSGRRALVALKNLWFRGARALSAVSGGRLYLGNLFVAARRPR